MPFEYRVVVDKGGIKSYDYYHTSEAAETRKKILLLRYESKLVYIQVREVSEWKNVT